MAQSFWCCIITRDGADTLGKTLDSIIGQSLRPSFIVVINDGSRDNTPEVISSKSRIFPNMFTINTGSKTRDIRRVPFLLNLGLEFAEKKGAGLSASYMMISGDDVELSRDYASTIMKRMEEDKRLVVASGSFIHSSAGRSNQMPHGAGRVVKMDFMKRIGSRYPIAYGWEPWLLYKALELGLKVKNYPDLRYNHLRPYNPGNLFGWGRAMYSLGFPSYFVFLRFLINFFWASRGTQSRKSSVTMLVGYLSAKLNPGPVRRMLIRDDRLKAFVKHYSTTRIFRVFAGGVF